MSKGISLFLVSLIVCQLAYGKSVDEQSAKMTGYNFLRSEGIQVDPSLLSLTYKASSTINGELITDFYVFNTGNTGFIIVSGDDNVIPVLGFSDESSFDPNYVPASVQEWLDNYKEQVNYVVAHNLAGNEKTVAEWSALQQPVTARSGAKTTATGVTPLLKTLWDQAPFYNSMCPYDATADTNAVTGCVATAMAQVMKYWKWPVQGMGSHTYSSPYGSLSANYSAATYKWDSMPNTVSKNNNFVATIMLHAGISVNMDYGAKESGAFVTAASSPITNCAEYALKTYFNYKPTLMGASRYSYSDSDWVHLIQSELDNKRPVLHTGSGTSGGHCFVVDGYIPGSRLHINWGWGGYYNGYYAFDNLAPNSSETFNSNMTLIVGITPNNPATLGANEIVTGGTTISVYPNPADDMIHINLNGAQATEVRISDMQGREMKSLPVSGTGLVNVPVQDMAQGLYIISLQTAGGVETRKVVISR